MFSIRVKALFQPIVLQKKKADGILFFLKTFSWETNLRAFMLNTQNWEGKSVFNLKSIK